MQLFLHWELSTLVRVCDGPCDISVELWNSSYIVLTVKLFIYTDNVSNQEAYQISFPQFVWEAKYETLCTQLVEKVCNIKFCICKQHIALLLFSFPNVICPFTLQLFLIFRDTGYEVLNVVKIYYMVWDRTVYSLEEHSGSIFTHHVKIEAVCPDQYCSTH